MRRSAIAAFPLLLATAVAAAPHSKPQPPDVAVSLRDEALASDLSWRLLESLTTEVGHRFTGSATDPAAVAWALRTMEGLGLESVHSEPVTVPHWVRGEAEGEILAPWPQPLHLIALGGSVGTPEEGVAAEVVELPSLEELEAADPASIAGRIVFLSQRMERKRDGSGYGATVPNRGKGPSAAALKGAVALLIRSVGTGNARLPHTGALRYAEDAPQIPAAALANPDADLLAAEIARGRPVRVRLRLTARRLPDTISANVIGEVRGRELPDEIVLLGAHLDSWDVGTGAVDDGAGCAIVLGAAGLIAKLPQAPRRTIRVVLFANEEFGLSGARAYAEAHADEIARHHLAIESDFGAGRVWRFAAAVDPAALPIVAAFAPRLEPLGIDWAGNSARGGADLIPLRQARVPAADLTQDGTDYFDVHHTDDDTLDKVEPAALAQNLAAHSVLAWLAAETPGALGPGPEVPAR